LPRRLWEHPILEFERGAEAEFLFEGKRIRAYEGESVAAALVASGVTTLAWSCKRSRPRGFFCGIGKCSSCLMTVDGIPNVRTCITPVRSGMVVERQRPLGELPTDAQASQEVEELDVDLFIVGAGPAGLSAAIEASKLGAKVAIADENFRPGGQLIKQTHKFFGSRANYAGVRGIEIARILLRELQSLEAEWLTRATVVSDYVGSKHTLLVDSPGRAWLVRADSVIVATGAMENMLPFPNNDLPGVMGAGGLQTLMHVFGVVPGERALIVGAGNVGLILAYQLLQAGVDVKAVVEIMPKIGGYAVHAAKIRRMGVPILLRHTVKRAIGARRVEAAEIVRVDENFRPIEGTEEQLDVDMLILAVGLTPSTEIPLQAGAQWDYVPELGGPVPIHDQLLRTTVDGMFVAGDASGIEEATTAMLEGRIAGAKAASELGLKPDKADKVIEEAERQLDEFRSGPFSEKVLKGKRKVWEVAREVIG